jgi:hypothetical protein
MVISLPQNVTQFLSTHNLEQHGMFVGVFGEWLSILLPPEIAVNRCLLSNFSLETDVPREE